MLLICDGDVIEGKWWRIGKGEKLVLEDTGTEALAGSRECGARLGLSTTLSVGCGVFLFLGHSVPFLPLPLGIVASANLVKLSVFFTFLYQATNSESFPLSSATATVCEQIFSAFQLGQS